MPARARPPLVLMYHGVADVPARRDPEGLFVRPADLRSQIARLRRWGYTLLTFAAVAERVAAGAGAGCAALTFDDGLANNLETLVPLLRDEGGRATVFPVSGWLGRPHPSVPFARIMTPDELRELYAAGIEIGSHTAHHRDLTTLSLAAARDEIRRGREALEEVLGAPVRTFAYPYGAATVETIRAAAEAGVEAACRTSGNGSWREPLNLPRQDMDGRTAIGMWLKREDRYEPLMRTVPGRAARRAVRLGRRVGG